jgi:hypothetical protein
VQKKICDTCGSRCLEPGVRKISTALEGKFRRYFLLNCVDISPVDSYVTSRCDPHGSWSSFFQCISPILSEYYHLEYWETRIGLSFEIFPWL